MNTAAIFDVDGVLVDSYDAHFRSWVLLFAELDYEYGEDEFRAGFGMTSHAILHEWSTAHGRTLDDTSIEQLDDRKESLYRELLSTSFRPVPGAIELIDDLAAVGFRLGVGSSGPPENVQAVLNQLPNATRFSAITTGADTTRGKPDPEVFLRVAGQLDVPAENCAVIEDAVHGVEAANSAGMVSIALTGTSTRDELAAANLIVDRLSELSAAKIADLLAR